VLRDMKNLLGKKGTERSFGETGDVNGSASSNGGIKTVAGGCCLVSWGRKEKGNLERYVHYYLKGGEVTASGGNDI